MLPYTGWPFVARLLVGVLLCVPVARLAQTNRAAFVPALFFAIHAVIAPPVFLALERLPFYVPQSYFLPAAVAYLAVLFTTPGLREHARWYRRGDANRLTIALGVILVVGSAGALVAWASFVAGDLTRFARWVPDLPLPLLVLYGVLFAAANALFEEFIARALLYDAFVALFEGRLWAAVVAQALLFALWHYDGFPGGPVGVGMVFVWSLFLGAMRHTSRGVVAPLVAHFFADLTIGGILLFAIVV